MRDRLEIGARVVLGARGPGRITGRRRRSEARGPVDYLVFEPDDDAMTVLIPEAGARQAGLRSPIPKERIPDVLARLDGPPPAIEGPPHAWRLERLHAGYPEDLVLVLRQLADDDEASDLSASISIAGVRSRLAAELAAATDTPAEDWVERIRARLAGRGSEPPAPSRGPQSP